LNRSGFFRAASQIRQHRSWHSQRCRLASRRQNRRRSLSRCRRGRNRQDHSHAAGNSHHQVAGRKIRQTGQQRQRQANRRRIRCRHHHRRQHRIWIISLRWIRRAGFSVGIVWVGVALRDFQIADHQGGGFRWHQRRRHRRIFFGIWRVLSRSRWIFPRWFGSGGRQCRSHHAVKIATRRRRA